MSVELESLQNVFMFLVVFLSLLSRGLKKTFPNVHLYKDEEKEDTV